MTHPPHPLTERRRKEIASLSQRKHRDQRRETIVEGLRSVEAALDAGAALHDILVAAPAADRYRSLLNRTDAPVHVLPERDFAAFSDVQTSQGILAVAAIRHYPASDLIQLNAILALDGVQDPGNTGTLIRTAAWFGADAVLTGPGTADLYNPKVVRAAMGGLWDLHVSHTTNLVETLRRLREHGFAVYGADMAGIDARSWTPRRPSVLILGSEAHGLSPQVTSLLDERITIDGLPRRGGAESLNVSIAGGILLFQWLGR